MQDKWSKCYGIQRKVKHMVTLMIVCLRLLTRFSVSDFQLVMPLVPLMTKLLKEITNRIHYLFDFTSIHFPTLAALCFIYPTIKKMKYCASFQYEGDLCLFSEQSTHIFLSVFVCKVA